MDFREAAQETKKVVEEIEAKRGRKWDNKTRFMDLVEEIGELSNAILSETGDKNMKRKKADIVDSICDVLFDLLILAGSYGIDLNREYPKVLEQIKERCMAGEFVD